ncbi:hypothetical protein Esti_006589 [Eimeria stiedai]
MTRLCIDALQQGSGQLKNGLLCLDWAALERGAAPRLSRFGFLLVRISYFRDAADTASGGEPEEENPARAFEKLVCLVCTRSGAMSDKSPLFQSVGAYAAKWRWEAVRLQAVCDHNSSWKAFVWVVPEENWFTARGIRPKRIDDVAWQRVCRCRRELAESFRGAPLHSAGSWTAVEYWGAYVDCS